MPLVAPLLLLLTPPLLLPLVHFANDLLLQLHLLPLLLRWSPLPLGSQRMTQPKIVRPGVATGELTAKNTAISLQHLAAFDVGHGHTTGLAHAYTR